jgi:uncharacterized protein (DUF433 family)
MSGNINNSWRTQPMYSFHEAAYLAGVSATTVRNWIVGYTVDERQVPPLLTPLKEQGAACSFLQLIEIVVAARFRKTEGVSFHIVKKAYDNAQKEFGLQFPFAHMKLKTIGGHIVHIIKDESSHQAIDKLEQWTLPGLILETIEQLEYEYELAARWYPVGKKIPIVVDPRVSAGLPVVEGRGVTIQTIRKRFYDARQSIPFIAKDFDLNDTVVEEIVRYAPGVLNRELITA